MFTNTPLRHVYCPINDLFTETLSVSVGQVLPNLSD